MDRIDRNHLIVHSCVVYIAVREIDLVGRDVKCDDGGIVDNARSIYHLNERAVVLVTDRSRLKRYGRKFMPGGTRGNAPDGRKIDGSLIEHEVIVLIEVCCPCPISSRK